MLLLLNSDYNAVKKTLKLNCFLAKVWASRHTKFISPPMATRLVATVFWLRAADQRRNSWLSEVYVHTNSVVQINQHYINNHYNSIYLVNLFTVSTVNPVIMLIFPINSLALCWGNFSNSNVTIKFAQSHYLVSQNTGGHIRYYVPPVQKLGRTCLPRPSINTVPATGNGKRSRLRRLKSGIPQGSVLAPLLFNIYISDLPTTISRKYAYADDLAIMHAVETGRQWKGCWARTWQR